MVPKLELCMTVKGYTTVGNDILRVKTVLNGPQRIFIPATRGFIKEVGSAAGLEAEINPASSDGVLMNPATSVTHLNMRVGAGSSSGDATFLQYSSILQVNEAGGKVISGAPDANSTEYGDQEWWVSLWSIQAWRSSSGWRTLCGLGMVVRSWMRRVPAVEYLVYRVLD